MEIIGTDGKVYKFEFAHYGDERPLNMTDGETVIAEYIKSLCPVEIVRKSDNYITAVAYNQDIVRFKCTDRAKWLLFPYNEHKPTKQRFDDPDELERFNDEILKACDIALEIDNLNKQG